jgi:hypothetical protein
LENRVEAAAETAMLRPGTGRGPDAEAEAEAEALTDRSTHPAVSVQRAALRRRAKPESKETVKLAG